jgi:hypothetical protein
MQTLPVLYVCFWWVSQPSENIKKERFSAASRLLLRPVLVIDIGLGLCGVSILDAAFEIALPTCCHKTKHTTTLQTTILQMAPFDTNMTDDEARQPETQ